MVRACRVPRGVTMVVWLGIGCVSAWAAGGGSATPIVIVADTRHLTGVEWFLGSLYNHSPAQFTALTIVLIPVTGVLFGVVADVVLGLLGIDLRTRGVSDH